MGINFGYGGYGIGSGVNQMGVNSIGSNTFGANQGGAIYQSIASQYNCPVCYQRGVVPYNLRTNVNPLPPQAFHQSWLSRIFGKFFG